MEKHISEKTEALREKYLQQGQLVYELYGIMIHSGGAYGGHYSAYIKDFEKQSWYHFNDTYVKKISLTDIVDVFGAMQNPKNKRLAANHANAYMLMYRLV